MNKYKLTMQKRPMYRNIITEAYIVTMWSIPESRNLRRYENSRRLAGFLGLNVTSPGIIRACLFLWWRWRDLNPRPERFPQEPLQV
jgi:hypothetical protein